MIHLIMISAIALAIGIGYRTKINIGLLAIAFLTSSQSLSWD